MPHEIRGFKLGGLCEKAGKDYDFDRTSARLDNNPKRLLWKHPNLNFLGSDPRSLVWGLNQDDHGVLKQFSLNTPTSHRTLCFDVQDKFGGAKYVVKGVGLTQNQYLGRDVVENADFIQNRRFGTVSSAGEAGKESVSAACADIGGFAELAKLNPQILLDFNGPIWQPLAVVNTGRKMVEGDMIWANREWVMWPYVQFGVVDVRRFPFTHWRVEDISFDSTRSLGEEEMKRLGRIWNLPDRSQVYQRAIKRWSQASNFFINSSVRHCQVFDYFRHKKTGLEYAWVNPNNIALDGSTGDLDCTRKYMDSPVVNDAKKGRCEALGGLLIYLYGIWKVDFQLLESDEFLRSVVSIFFANIDQKTNQSIKLDGDLLDISRFCRNSRILYDLNTSDNEFMPGRSPLQKYKNRVEILPFMESMSLRISELIN